MKKKFFISLLVFVLLLIVSVGLVAAESLTPSTNEINKGNGWAHFNVVSVGVGEAQIQFVQPRGFLACFEYRSDGDTSQKIGSNYNPLITDGLYPFYCLNGSSATHTIGANEYFEIRMVFGAEGDERFDWTRVDVLQPVGLCHRTASDSNPYVYIEVSDMAIANSHILNLANGHPQKYWKYDGVFLGVAHSAGDPKDDYLAESEEDCFDEEIVVNEPCGRCSNVFVGWVEWVDRDGGCDDDFYNERVEYPYDERCYENCQEGNTAEVQTFDSGWYDDGLPYDFGDWYANPQPPQFQREGSQDQLRDYAGDVIDINTQDVCWPYEDQDSRTVSVFEDEIAEKDPKIRTGSNCVKAWAWVRYFDPDGNKFVDGPRVYEFWTLSAYEPESVEILGKIVHKKDRCLLDIPEPPICPEGYSMVQAPVFNTETGQWEGLVCDQDCKPVPIIKYTIAGNFPCIYYGRTERGDTTEKLPYWIQDQIAAGGCDLLDRVGCDGVTSIPDAYWVGTGDFEAKYIDSCYTPPTCVGCDGKEVPAYNPLFPW